MGLQIVLCVESDKRAGTDNIYIKETINRYYSYGNELKISFINMNGKSNYNANKVRKAIKQLETDYKIGKKVVIYCIDVDRIDLNPNQVGENNKIKDYITENGYELIWFFHDIEEVYIGSSIDKKQKTKNAMAFKLKGKIWDVNTKKISAKRIAHGSSNILVVLDKYLSRKND